MEPSFEKLWVLLAEAGVDFVVVGGIEEVFHKRFTVDAVGQWDAGEFAEGQINIDAFDNDFGFPAGLHHAGARLMKSTLGFSAKAG